MTTEAIPAGDVSEEIESTEAQEPIVESGELEQTPEPTVRDSIMESIVAKRTEERDAEIKLDNPDIQEPPADKVIPVKVNGVEAEVSEDEIRKYQKGKSAELRLEEAAQARAELADREAAFSAREEAFKAQRAALEAEVSPPKPAQPAVDVTEAADELIAAVFAEDTAAVASAIEKVTRAAQPSAQVPAVPAAPQVVTISDDELAAKMQRLKKVEEQRVAISRFEAEYPELNNNKSFKDVVDARTIREFEKDPKASIWDIVERAAEHTKRTMADTLGVTFEGKAAPKKVQPKAPNSAIRSSGSKRYSKPAAPPAKTPFQEVTDGRYMG